MKWLLNFNIVKTFVMHLGNSNPCLTYYMDGQPLQVVSEHKYLGIIVDSSLKFHSQATSAINRDQSILLFSHLFFFPAILLFFTYYAPYFAQEL